jgi:outer membrane lipoprotein-sorting protein
VAQRTAVLLCFGICLAAPALAAPPSAMQIAEGMKAALEPPKPSLRAFEVTITAPEGGKTSWIGRQARKQLPDGRRMLTILLSPTDLRGTAVLSQERPGEQEVQWAYLPALRRVRKLVDRTAFESVLGTDVTYSDMGFFSVTDRTFEYLGEEKVDGRSVYKLQEVPKDKWLFSRVVSYVDPSTMLPVRREYYDLVGELWKVALRDNSAVVEGIPTPLHYRMEDKQAGGSTDVQVTEVRYNVELPDDLFQPNKLPQAASNPVWGPPSSK